jgi:hypothetical protein
MSCRKCDGKGNFWLVTYVGEKTFNNFFGEGKPLIKGTRINMEVYDRACLAHKQNKLFTRDPHSKLYFDEEKASIQRKVQEYKERVKDPVLIEQYASSLLITLFFEIAKRFGKEDLEIELNSIQVLYLVCNECEVGKKRLNAEKSVQGF